jgi:transcriptional regulator with XRE-family HTH domain
MEFKDRLKWSRENKGLSQAELGRKSGLAERTIQNYERGVRNPQKYKNVAAIASVLGVSPEFLLGNDGMLIVDASERGGSASAREIRALVTEVSGLFAGGELTDEDKDAAIRALTDAYWESKSINKKYAPKKRGKKQ